MTPLCIVLTLILLIILLLCAPVTVSFSVNTQRGENRVRIRYLGGVWLDSQKPKKKKPKKKKPEKPKEKRTAKDYLALFRRIAPAIPPALKKLWKGIRLSDLTVGVRVCRLDAARCATDYGKVCAIIYPALRVCQDWMRVEVRTIQVRYLFAAEDATDVIVSGNMKLTPAAALGAVLSFVFGMVKSSPKAQDSPKKPDDAPKAENKEEKTDKTDKTDNPKTKTKPDVKAEARARAEALLQNRQKRRS